ncbi:MAG: hypothetical protein KDD58_07715 [Bdellovibrionales bacterium]|nr:hypothetical protein [Bdellovibrionales bacterium]
MKNQTLTILFALLLTGSLTVGCSSKHNKFKGLPKKTEEKKTDNPATEQKVVKNDEVVEPIKVSEVLVKIENETNKDDTTFKLDDNGFIYLEARVDSLSKEVIRAEISLEELKKNLTAQAKVFGKSKHSDSLFITADCDSRGCDPRFEDGKIEISFIDLAKSVIVYQMQISMEVEVGKETILVVASRTQDVNGKWVRRVAEKAIKDVKDLNDVTLKNKTKEELDKVTKLEIINGRDSDSDLRFNAYTDKSNGEALVINFSTWK